MLLLKHSPARTAPEVFATKSSCSAGPFPTNVWTGAGLNTEAWYILNPSGWIPFDSSTTGSEFWKALGWGLNEGIL